MASKNNKNKFFTILFLFYLTLSLFRFIWPVNIILPITMVVLGLFVLILLSIRIRREYFLIYIFILFLITFFLISSLVVWRTERVVIILLFIMCNFGIAMILLKGYVYSWGGYIVFYSLTGYFMIAILAGIKPDDILSCSRNGISIAMLVACISLYIILSIEDKKIDLIPSLITLIISIWAMGRSGIFSSLFLFLGLLFIKVRWNIKYIFIVMICLFTAYCFFDDLYNLVIKFSFFRNSIDLFIARFEAGPETRIAIWGNYFNNLDISRVIFGVNVYTDPWPDGALNEYNYHNAFINLHLYTGLAGLIVIVLIIFTLFKFLMANKVFFFLFLIIILRFMTDTGLFFDAWGFIAYFFIFYFLKDYKFRLHHS